ncbi:MAG: thiamine diphosphokinase [Calditrichia bacterium]
MHDRISNSFGLRSALVVANGGLSKNELSKISGQLFDLIVAADGGADSLIDTDYSPNLIVGDLDSVSSAARQAISPENILHIPSQESTDLEKALLVCRDRGITDITLVGAFGKRLDHTLNNLSILCRYDRQFTLTLLEKFSQLFLVRESWEYHGHPGQTVSLIPLSAISAVQTTGLVYPLNSEPLALGVREGSSNEITTGAVRVEVSNGVLAVFVLDD